MDLAECYGEDQQSVLHCDSMYLHFSCFRIGKLHHQCSYVAIHTYVIITATHADTHTKLICLLATNNVDSPLSAIYVYLCTSLT